MSAICGYWSRAGSLVSRATVERMMAALAMYGGDRTAQWVSGPIALGIVQRRRVPEDRGDRQPMLDRGIAVLADVRLDNRTELMSILGLSGDRWAGAADAALLTEAWLRWGPALVNRLVGPFAIVVWDSRTDTLFLGRDPMGLHPLCYAATNDGFAVASMPKGITAASGRAASLDRVRMAEYLALLPSDGSRTYSLGVTALPPGYTATVVGGQITLHRYWAPPLAGSLTLPNDDAYVEQFRNVLSTAVQSSLRSEGVIASTVSGGLDSPTVTSVAAVRLAATGRRLIAVTWVPRSGHIGPLGPGHIGDEREHAAAVVARHANVDHVLVEAPDAYLPDVAEAQSHATDQPVLLPDKVPLLAAMASALHERGCRTMLESSGGNMTMSYSGLSLPTTLIRRGQLIRWASEAGAFLRAGTWSWRHMVRSAADPFLPSFAWDVIDRARHGPSLMTALLRPEFGREIGVGKLATARGWNLHRPGKLSADVLRMKLGQRVDVGIWRRGQYAISGIDTRDPTMNRRLVEFCWGIPEDQFLRSGRTRWLLRRAMADVLPPLILNETRAGVQSADWPRYVMPYKARYTAEVDAFERSPAVSAMLNLPFLRSLLAAWPVELTPAHRLPYGNLLTRGIVAGRFIQRMEG